MRSRIPRAPPGTRRFLVGQKIWSMDWLWDLDAPYFQGFIVKGVGDTFTSISRVDPKSGNVSKHIFKVQTASMNSSYSEYKTVLVDRYITKMKSEIETHKRRIIDAEVIIKKLNQYRKEKM